MSRLQSFSAVELALVAAPLYNAHGLDAVRIAVDLVDEASNYLAEGLVAEKPVEPEVKDVQVIGNIPVKFMCNMDNVAFLQVGDVCGDLRFVSPDGDVDLNRESVARLVSLLQGWLGDE